MICDSMKAKAKRNTSRLLKRPIDDLKLFDQIKQLPFFRVDKEYSLDSILRSERIYSSRHLTRHLKKLARGNTYPTDVYAGLDAYVFLSFGTIPDFGGGCPYGDVLMEFDSSIVNLDDCYFTAKDINCYEALWNVIDRNPSIPMDKHRSPYIDNFYELHAIYHYFYHYIKNKGINDFDTLLSKIYSLKVYPPEVKIYHSLSLDYMKKLYIIPNKHYLNYAKKKKYKNRVQVTIKEYGVTSLTHTVLKRKFDPTFQEINEKEELIKFRKLINLAQ